jgi:hypothetical protein
MKYALFLSLFCTSSLLAQELTPIASPDLKSPLPSEWVMRQGTWEIKDGVLIASEIPEQKHAAVLWHEVALQTGVVECEFLFDGARGFLLGCDGGKHIGRITINSTEIRLIDDSTEVKGKSPGTILASAKTEVKPGEWHKLRFEWSGERMAAKLDDAQVEASNVNLGVKKSRWWIAVSGATVKIRNVTVFGAQP